VCARNWESKATEGMNKKKDNEEHLNEEEQYNTRMMMGVKMKEMSEAVELIHSLSHSHTRESRGEDKLYKKMPIMMMTKMKMMEGLRISQVM